MHQQGKTRKNKLKQRNHKDNEIQGKTKRKNTKTEHMKNCFAILAQGISFKTLVVHTQVKVAQFLVLVMTLLHAAQRMERCSIGMGADCSRTSPQSRTMAVGSGSPPESSKADFTAAPASEWECQSEGELNTQDQIRRIHQGEQFAGGFGYVMWRRRGLCSWPWQRHRNKPRSSRWRARSRSRRIFSTGSGNGCPQRTRRSGWLRRQCKKRLTRQITTSANSPWPKHAWNGFRRRLRRHVKQHQAPHLQCPISKLRFKGCGHSWPECRLPRHRFAHHKSSALSADLLRERASKRRAGFTETTRSDPQDLEGWMANKHMELRDAIEFGDQESILSHGSDPHRCGTAQRASFHCLQHGCDMRVFAKIVTHQCGWLGCRVREATNPGPPRRIRRALSVASSSDYEPLVRPSGVDAWCPDSKALEVSVGRQCQCLWAC